MESAIEVALHDLDPSSDLPLIQTGLDRIDALLADICMVGSAAPYSNQFKQRSQELATPSRSSNTNYSGNPGLYLPSIASESSNLLSSSSSSFAPSSPHMFHPVSSPSSSAPSQQSSSIDPTPPLFYGNNDPSNPETTNSGSRANMALSDNPKYSLFCSLQNDVSYNLASRLIVILRHLLTKYRRGMLDLCTYIDELSVRESSSRGRNSALHSIGTSSTGIGGTGGTQRGLPNNLFVNKGSKKQIVTSHPQKHASKGLGLGDPSTSFGTINSEAYLNDHSDDDNSIGLNNNLKKGPVKYPNSNEEKINRRYNKKQPLSSSIYSTNSDDEREEEALEASDAFFQKELNRLQEYTEDEFNNNNNNDTDEDLERLCVNINETAQLLTSLENIVIQTLNLLHGVLLLHAPSRALCASKSTMLLFLELVYFDKQVAAQISSSSSSSGSIPATRSSSSSSSDSSYTGSTTKSGRSMASGLSSLSRLSSNSVVSEVSERSNMGRRPTKNEMINNSSSQSGLNKSKLGKNHKDNSSSKHPRRSSKTESTSSNNSSSSLHQEDNLILMYSPSIQISGISTLVSAMVREPRTIRMFEACNGVETMCRLFKSKETPKTVKLRILEFLFFYLIPETKNPILSSSSNGKDNNNGAGNSDAAQLNLLKQKKTTEEKSKMLRKYLGNVDGLLAELESSKPFGDLDNIEW